MHVQHLLSALEPEYTTWAGFAKRPVQYYPIEQRVAPVIVPAVSTQTVIPNYDTSQTFTYTAQQLREMQERAIAAAQEITARQGNEYGDGLSPELEQRATEENATDKAVNDAYESDANFTAKPKPPENAAGLLSIAALAYFLFF